jgi:hypothetical protein
MIFLQECCNRTPAGAQGAPVVLSQEATSLRGMPR